MRTFFSALFLSFLMTSASADCKDTFITRFSVNPSPTAVWVSPDKDESRLQLPLKWLASAEGAWLSLDVMRVSAAEVEVTFSRGGKLDGAQRPFRALIAMSEAEPVALARTFKDDLTGDVWALSLRPVCQKL